MLDQKVSLEESKNDAKRAGLKYIVPSQLGHSAHCPGIQRKRHGKSFFYVNARGARITDAKTLERIRKLAIPPAYDNVWIASDAKAHLQVIGVDARGRKQYRYHPKWRLIKDQSKYSRMLEFAHSLPNIRTTTESHLRRHLLSREKVLAAVVQLLEKTMIRVGNDEYAKTNHSFGLSTLHHEHVQIHHHQITFHFKGKSRIQHNIILKDAHLAKVVSECHALRGRELFRYEGQDGSLHRIHAQDVNQYLKTVSGKSFTAKDFRTWGATLYAASLFHETCWVEGKTKIKQVVNQVIDQVAEKLGNTRSICKKSYIHPALVDAFIENKKILKSRANLENQVIRFLKSV